MFCKSRPTDRIIDYIDTFSTGDLHDLFLLLTQIVEEYDMTCLPVFSSVVDYSIYSCPILTHVSLFIRRGSRNDFTAEH